MLDSEQQAGKPDYDFPRRSTKDILKQHNSSVSKTFKEAYATLKPLKKESTLSERKTIAENMRSTVSTMKQKLPSGTSENLWLAAEFICRMLVIKKDNSKSKIRNNSIAARNLIFNLPDNIPIYDLSEKEIAQTVKQIDKSYNSAFILKGCQAFCDFLHSHLGNRFPIIDLRSMSITKEKFQYPVPLIYPFHVDSAVKSCENTLCSHALSLKNTQRQETELRKARHRASMAQHMVNLGFYGSLRESEFTGLRIRNVIFDANGMNVYIGESKSNNGKRNIPLLALAPDSYQEQFNAYYRKRLSETSSGNEWLFPDDDGSRLNANFMAGRIQAIFKRVGIRNMVFHDLRHGFANFFMLRWFHAFYPEFFPEGLSILKNELFHEPYINRLKKLIFGENCKTGQEHFTHGIAALSILIGHGGSVLTFEEYIHTADWLFYLISKSLESKEIPFTSQQATNILQVSYPTLPNELKGRGLKIISFGSLLKFQQQHYEKLLGVRIAKRAVE